MATFLFIDTAAEKALVGISRDNVLLAVEENNVPNTHANFAQVAVATVLKKAGIPIQNLDAIVVTMGPGSYTGLRVGLATAKGIAYTIQKPLIGLSTLNALAAAAIQLAELQQQFYENSASFVICSMSKTVEAVFEKLDLLDLLNIAKMKIPF